MRYMEPPEAEQFIQRVEASVVHQRPANIIQGIVKTGWGMVIIFFGICSFGLATMDHARTPRDVELAIAFLIACPVAVAIGLIFIFAGVQTTIKTLRMRK